MEKFGSGIRSQGSRSVFIIYGSGISKKFGSGSGSRGFECHILQKIFKVVLDTCEIFNKDKLKKGY
jgi:hypothetical protein